MHEIFRLGSHTKIPRTSLGEKLNLALNRLQLATCDKVLHKKYLIWLYKPTGM